MSDRFEWFAPKKYGYGAGLPIAWQGWVLTIFFTGVTVGIALAFARKPLLLFATVLPLVLVYAVIAARTTKGLALAVGQGRLSLPLIDRVLGPI